VRGFFAGLVVGIAVILLGLFVYFEQGFAPVAASAPPMPFEKMLARMALHAHLEKEQPAKAGIEASEANYLAGAQAYLDNCAVCHGAPGRQPTPVARGMFPRPPQLLHGKGVTDDPPGETYWKTANGIRMTGMPGFKDSLSETQMWQISLLLANADKLPASANAVLAGQAPTLPQTPPAAGSQGPGK